MRQLARQIIKAALQAVDPAVAVKTYFDTHPRLLESIQERAGRIFVVGAGKAGEPMAAAIYQIFGDRITAGQVVVKYGYTAQAETGPIRISQAGHPLPDEAGLQAARQIIELLEQAGADDLVICLISGGGSALLTLPAEPLTLADLQTATESLLAAGATINQINTIRKHLSAVKGGRLAQRAAPAPLYALILSDVVGDPLEVIASGPTVPDPTTFAEAEQIVQQYGLRLPEAVTARLEAGRNGQVAETPKPGQALFQQVHNAIIGSNRLAAQAAVEAARSAGWQAALLTTFVEGEAREVGQVMAGLLKGLRRGEGPLSGPACLVAGGETTVTVRGQGRGGRNQEMALAAAIALTGWPGVLIACLGTDGTDGPTDAAGAFADGRTVEKAQAMGIEAVEHLAQNNAYNFFAALDDLIITGPTRTNVNDLILLLAEEGA